MPQVQGQSGLRNKFQAKEYKKVILKLQLIYTNLKKTKQGYIIPATLRTQRKSLTLRIYDSLKKKMPK